MSAPSGPVRLRTPPGQLPPMQAIPPHHYEHPSIAPLANVPDNGRNQNSQPLPEIQAWLNSPPPSSSQLPHGARNQEQNSSYRSQPSPPLGRVIQLRAESRTPPSSHSG